MKPEDYTAKQTSKLHPLVCLTDAVVVRGGNPILAVDSFSLDCGESIAILGPNGSGKSTFAKLITREIFPLHRDDPPVLFKGSSKTPLEEVKKHIGAVSSTMQDQIAVHLPAIDIVCGGLFGALGIPPHCTVSPGIYVQAMAAMEMFGVKEFADRDVLTLSTGQARRVLFARAMVHGPEALVFDEPCSGLDPEGRYYVRKSMRKLADAGRSIVLITHHPEDIIPEIERVVLLRRGTVFADGRKDELMTDELVSRLFGVPLQITRKHGYYSLVSEY